MSKNGKNSKGSRTTGASAPRRTTAQSPNNGGAPSTAPVRVNEHGIPDWRLENPNFTVVEARDGDHLHYEVRGDFSAPPPPIRESRYLAKEQCLELFRWMLLNRRMEQALENLYKQGQVVGGVYFGLGQEGCSCASAYALDRNDWLAPMIRNQGSLLVRGFKPRDLMMQYMAKSGSPTHGKDGTSHFGELDTMRVVSPISMLGDLIPVMAGVALGARLQGSNVACMTYIGDGGQSTGVTYEGINLAAVRKLGLVLIVENNLWAYSTPTEFQFATRDLANRAIGYGIPAVIIDGTDPCQVYDACHEACERARRGEGATLIEAKMMRMKGHAIHDAASYVPVPMLDYWRKRDCNTRFEAFLLAKKWITPQGVKSLIAGVEADLEQEREFAINSPMPEAKTAAEGVYCDAGCHDIKPRYAAPKANTRPGARPQESEAALHFK